ncbi:hypothetical protein B0O99DRAFT_690963 [Bisporella sp. PMI_857]|nr:hypothetical protein B0O99DRAFT_690963 [Bisporella sp. PMI_857]
MEYRPSPADQERTDRLMQEYNILHRPVRASEQPAPYDAMEPPQNSYYFPSESKNQQQQQDAQQPYSQNLNPGLQTSIEPRPSQSYSRSPYVQPKTFLMRPQTPPIPAASTSGLSKTSPLRKRSPGNPNYYTDSPLPFASIPVPGRLSPYSLNRPKKRPGFWKRITAKLSSLIRSLRSWTKNNPITAGFLTFLPVLTLAGAVKLGRVLGKGMGLISKTQQGVGGGKEKGKGKDKKGREWGYGLEKFVSFNGTKGGPMDGVLKILQMLM